MADYPYTLNTGNLDDFLSKMTERPLPNGVTYEYLRSTGYASSNDRAIATVLRFIGFLDGSKPTTLFESFRDTQKAKSVMAEALKTNCSDLFELSTNPNSLKDEELENFFRTKTGRGGRTLKATVLTYKTLLKFADFEAQPFSIDNQISSSNGAQRSSNLSLPITNDGGINLDISIRIELPITQDAEVYDKIFKSLKKNILDPSTETN